MQTSITFNQIEVVKIYELDGIRYRCLKLNESGLGVFQKINEDGTDYYKWRTGFPDKGRRIIFKRIKELVELN